MPFEGVIYPSFSPNRSSRSAVTVLYQSTKGTTKVDGTNSLRVQPLHICVGMLQRLWITKGRIKMIQLSTAYDSCVVRRVNLWIRCQVHSCFSRSYLVQINFRKDLFLRMRKIPLENYCETMEKHKTHATKNF